MKQVKDLMDFFKGDYPSVKEIINEVIGEKDLRGGQYAKLEDSEYNKILDVKGVMSEKIKQDMSKISVFNSQAGQKIDPIIIDTELATLNLNRVSALEYVKNIKNNKKILVDINQLANKGFRRILFKNYSNLIFSSNLSGVTPLFKAIKEDFYQIYMGERPNLFIGFNQDEALYVFY